MEVGGGGKHFVLVHGLCHGAWCWYKVATALESAGHRVTALDLAAAGAHPARLHEVRSFEDYSRPLLDAVAAAPDGDRLVLVGHSHGGLSLALAMERFPHKVAAAVFVAAALPCVGKHMGVTTEEFMRRTASKGLLMDCQVVPINDGADTGPGSEAAGGKKGVAIVMGPRFMEEKYYQESPAEDLTLAKMLVRPGNQFLDDPVMKDEALLTAANYGSVKKVFVVAKADESSTEEMQRWMVEMSPGTEVEEIAGADHAVMNSKATELCDFLGRIASRCD
ncbi:esterase PIR7B-like [Miscanthus floridulus]|uniref:esterase PIR7B-like n=1 Tax=Miscanthus floridulus TaxID=154761 RepID=UPI003457A5E0